MFLFGWIAEEGDVAWRTRGPGYQAVLLCNERDRRVISIRSVIILTNLTALAIDPRDVVVVIGPGKCPLGLSCVRS